MRSLKTQIFIKTMRVRVFGVCRQLYLNTVFFFRAFSTLKTD